MKYQKTFSTMIAVAGFTAAAYAQPVLYYGFDTDAEGFQNVTWQGADPIGWGDFGTVKMGHSAGGWQMLLTKEFSWGTGGGNDNQQLAMQELGYYGADAHVAFDVMWDGTSFEAGAGEWFSFNVVGNSDGTAGWTQTEHVIDGWQNPDQSDLRMQHVVMDFTQLGWGDGDSTWFQLYLGANSGYADNHLPAPVANFYIDNLVVYANEVPEPSTFALAGFGIAALLTLRRRS